MLKRTYDWVCLGENLFSLVFSLGALSNQKKTTILKDPRFDGPPVSQMILDHLFVELLQHWGRDQMVAPLMEMRQGLVPKQVHLIVDNTRLRLGSTPADNITELARKLPFLFPAQTLELIEKMQSDRATFNSFNQEVLESVSRIAGHLYLYRSMQTLTIQEFMSLLPLSLRQWVEHVYQWGQSPDVALTSQWWIWKSFIYIISAHFRASATLNVTFAELAYLLLQCLLPIYGLKGEGPLQGLRSDFIRQGGVIRDTNIIDWHFEKGKLWALELSSYEGVVYPKDVFIFSDHLPSSCPISLLQRQDALRCVALDLPYDAPVPGDVVMGVDSQELANECPFWKLTYRPGNICIQLFVKQRSGQLASLYAEQFFLLLQKLKSVYLWPCQLPTEKELLTLLSFRNELFERPMHWDNWRQNKREFPRFSPARLTYQDSVSQDQSKADGVWYMGPHLGRFLGPVGTPLEMKQFLFSSRGRGEKLPTTGSDFENTAQL